jgi:putative drug exporter of the RND superfamily
MLARLGELVFRRAKLVLALTGVTLVAAAVLGVGAFGVLKNGGFDDPGSASSRAAQVIADQYGGQSNLVLLVHAKTGGVDGGGATASGTRLTDALKADGTVTGVVSYWTTHSPALRSHDGTSALILADVTGDDKTIIDTTHRIITAYGAGDPTVTVSAGGLAAVNDAVTTQVTKDLALAEGIAIPLTMVLLVFAFGSFVAASLPLTIGLVAILGTFAELAVLGRVTDVSIFSVNLTTALGLGLGIDYALLIVARFRENLALGLSVHDAVLGTVRTAGRTIAFSAATVAAALAALLVFPLYFLRSFAYAGIGVVIIAALSALIIMPALLTVLGHRVNAGKLPWARTDRGPSAPAWGRLAGFVTRRPALTALPVIAVLAVVASPLFSAGFGTPDETVLPSTTSVRHLADALRTDFPGDQSTALQVVTIGTRPADAASVADYAARLSALPHAVRVDSSAGSFAAGHAVTGGQPSNQPLAAGDTQRLNVYTDVPSHSATAQALLHDARALPGPQGSSTLVGGETARLIDTEHAIITKLPYAIAWVVLTTFLVLFLFTGSLTQPLRALILNTLGLSASIGAMVWIFQYGRLSGVLGFTPRPMDTAMTVLLFCIAFGLSMDYEVFVISRIKELHDAGAGDTEAVTEGLTHTGRIVSTAAGLLAVSFFAFGTASVSFLQMFGLGCGLAILIDALLIRGVLVPAAMRVMGPYAWWAPGPLRRLHDRIRLTEAADDHGTGAGGAVPAGTADTAEPALEGNVSTRM